MIIICGTPGTGKTEVAKRLSRFGFTVIHLSEFIIREKLYLNYDVKRNYYVIDPEKMIKRIHQIKEQEKKLIIEGVGAELIPPEYVDLCIVLICEPKELEKRLLSKGFSRDKISENLEAERLSIVWGEALDRYGQEKVFVIDTTNLSVDEIVNIVLDELSRRGLIRRDDG